MAAQLGAILTLGWAPGALLLALSDPLPAQVPAAQTGRITGTVTGEAREPLSAVQVSIPNTGLGAVTGDDGRYTIAGVPAGTYQLRAQRIGYAPEIRQITVAAGQTVTAHFQLAAVAATLSTQVVVGYTTQQRRDVSDAVSSVRAEDIEDQQVATVEEALRGRVPGVQINASGEPGRPAQIIIRGQNFLGSATPLYVVDGMYLRQNPNLNPDEIASIEVLKDASAAAQYGAQAANGVVVIQTKRGRTGPNRIEIRSYYGTQEVPKRLDMMSASEWAAIQRQAYENAGQPVPAGVTQALEGTARTTDWQDAVFTSGVIQDYNLAMSGGNPAASYLVSGGYMDQRGSIIETGFRRYSVRVNSDLRRGRLRIGENIALSRTSTEGLSGFPLIDVVRMLPTIPVRDTANESGYGFGSGANPTFGTNPVGLLERQPRTQRSNQVIGSAFAELELLRNLRYRLNLGLNYEGFGRSDFTSMAQLRMGSPRQFAELFEARSDFRSLLAEHLLTYDNTFREGVHRVNAVAGYTEQQQDNDVLTAYRQGFTDENLRTINAGEEPGLRNSGFQVRSVLQSYLFRANYSLLERYLFTGSVRRDGSSRFGPNFRWGTFSAASVGWVVSDEGFYQSLPALGAASFLKLRASTGELGNQDIGDYRFMVPLNQGGLGYAFDDQIFTGATPLDLANPDIRWQSNRMSNIGVDLGLLGDRLTAAIDYYRSTSSGLLVEAPIPLSLGAGNTPVVNAGSMRNSGFELGTTYRLALGDFQLNTTASLTTTRNRVLSLGNGGQPLFDQTGAARTTVGRPLGEFFLIRTAGIFQSAEEVQAHTTTLEDGTVAVIQPNAEPGDVRYVDANGDGRINLEDRVPVGSGSPRYSGGLFLDARWRAFDFGLNLRGAGGFKIFSVARYWTERMDDPSNFRRGFSPWTPENPSSTTPRALARGSDNTIFLSDRWIEDGGYLRLQNIVLGYTLPESMSQQLATGSTARVYLNLQNLYTFTDYSFWDPETLGFGNPLGRGVDDGRIYPNVRTVTFGLDLRL